MTQKLKILAIPSWYPSDSNMGFGIFVKRHLIEISRFCEVHVLYFDFDKRSGPTGSRYVLNYAEGIYEHIVNVSSPKVKFFSLFMVWYWYARLVLFGPLRRHNVKHVHVLYHVAAFLAPFLLFSRKPLVITEHWSGYFPEDGRYAKLSGLYRTILKAVFKKAIAITAVSEALASAIRDVSNKHVEVKVVPNVVDQGIQVRTVTGIRPDSFLMIANFNDTEKNLTGVIEAFMEFKNRHPKAILTIVGTGPDFEMIKKYVIAKGMDLTSVHLPGYVSPNNLFTYFSGATCYILNSNFETFSISTLEALLYGVPVIATKCKGPEAFVNIKNGILIDIGSKDQLLSAMELMSQSYLNYNPSDVRNSIPAQVIANTGESFYDIYNQIVTT